MDSTHTFSIYIHTFYICICDQEYNRWMDCNTILNEYFILSDIVMCSITYKYCIRIKGILVYKNKHANVVVVFFFHKCLLLKKIFIFILWIRNIRNYTKVIKITKSLNTKKVIEIFFNWMGYLVKEKWFRFWIAAYIRHFE